MRVFLSGMFYVRTCKSTADSKQPATSMVAWLLTDFSLSEEWCNAPCVWGWLVNSTYLIHENAKWHIVWGWLVNSTYLIHENAKWHIVCCYKNPYIPSDCQRGSLVEGFSSNDKKNEWSMGFSLPSPCACNLMIPKMLRQDIKRKESMGHHCNLMIIIHHWHRKKTTFWIE